MDARHKGMWTYVYRGYRRTTKAVGNVHPKEVPLPWNEQSTPVERAFHSRQPLGSLQPYFSCFLYVKLSTSTKPPLFLVA